LKRLWIFVKNNFLTRKFLTFGIIGVINTLIHMGIYWIFYNVVFQEGTSSGVAAFVSNTVAFIGASTFSYFANAVFTFTPTRRSAVQFSIVLLVFLVRLLISNLLTTGFDYAIIHWVELDYALHPWTSVIAPFLGSVFLIPIAFFALDAVFRKTDVKKTDKLDA
jgi:putative flippase GtrA